MQLAFGSRRVQICCVGVQLDIAHGRTGSCLLDMPSTLELVYFELTTAVSTSLREFHNIFMSFPKIEGCLFQLTSVSAGVVRTGIVPPLRLRNKTTNTDISCTRKYCVLYRHTKPLLDVSLTLMVPVSSLKLFTLWESKQCPEIVLDCLEISMRVMCHLSVPLSDNLMMAGNGQHDKRILLNLQGDAGTLEQGRRSLQAVS